MTNWSTRTMKTTPAILATASLIALAACSGQADTAADTAVEQTSTVEPTMDEAAVSEEPAAVAEPTETSEAEPEPETTPEPEQAAEDLPARDEMEPWERSYAEAFFVNEVRDRDIGELHTDDELVAAGDAACDALDGGKPLRGVLVDVAEATPQLENVEATAMLAGLASGVLCPEHAPE